MHFMGPNPPPTRKRERLTERDHVYNVNHLPVMENESVIIELIIWI